MAYYSMMRRKPAGKYPRQVCTNVSCMLRGGNSLYEFVQKKLEIGHKETTADGHVFAGRSGMHRRLHRRARHAGELRFLRKLDH